MNLNLRIKELRHKKGVSQEELAKQIGVSRQAVAKWESGVNYPELENIARLCEYFEITADQMIKGDDDDGVISADVFESISTNAAAAAKERTHNTENTKKHIYTIIKVAVVSIIIIAIGIALAFLITPTSDDYAEEPSVVIPTYTNLYDFSFSNCDSYIESMLGSGELTEETASKLIGLSDSQLQAELSTFDDCLAYFDSYGVLYNSAHNYSNSIITDDIYRGYESRLSIGEISNEVKDIYNDTSNFNKIGINIVLALTSHYLADDYEESGYMLVFTDVSNQFSYIVLNYFYIDGKYCIVAPDSFASYDSGSQSRMLGKYFVYFEVDDLCDVPLIYEDLLNNMSKQTVYQVVKVDASNSVVWGEYDGTSFIQGGESIYQVETETVSRFTEENVQDYMTEYKYAISSIEDLFDFCNENNITFASSGDIKTVYNGDTWQYNKDASQVVLDGEAVCGSFANLASYMLGGDFNEVGQIGIMYAEGYGGGHVISYVFDGKYYYVFDASSWASSLYSSSSLKILQVTDLSDIATRLDEVLLGDTSVIVTLISYTDENDMPIIFGDKTAIYPAEADIDVIFEDTASGYSVTFKSLPDYKTLFNRSVSSVATAIDTSQYSDDAVIEDYILQYQSDISTVKELFDFCSEQGFTFPSDVGDLTYFYDLHIWHYNRSVSMVIDETMGGCGSFANLASFMLDGDFAEVGQIGIAYTTEWGGHVISYVFDGSKYYVFDVSSWSSKNYSSSSYNVLVLDDLSELSTRIGEIISGDASAVMTIVSYTWDSDMPVALGETVYYPDGYDINIIKESPEFGYTVEFKEFDNFEDHIVRNVPHYVD